MARLAADESSRRRSNSRHHQPETRHRGHVRLGHHVRVAAQPRDDNASFKITTDFSLDVQQSDLSFVRIAIMELKKLLHLMAILRAAKRGDRCNSAGVWSSVPLGNRSEAEMIVIQEAIVGLHRYGCHLAYVVDGLGGFRILRTGHNSFAFSNFAYNRTLDSNLPASHGFCWPWCPTSRPSWTGGAESSPSMMAMFLHFGHTVRFLSQPKDGAAALKITTDFVMNVRQPDMSWLRVATLELKALLHLFGILRAAKRGDRCNSNGQWSSVPVGDRSEMEMLVIEETIVGLHQYACDVAYVIDSLGGLRIRRIAFNTFAISQYAAFRTLDDGREPWEGLTWAMMSDLAIKLTAMRGQAGFYNHVPMGVAVPVDLGANVQPTNAQMRAAERELRIRSRATNPDAPTGRRLRRPVTALRSLVRFIPDVGQRPSRLARPYLGHDVGPGNQAHRYERPGRLLQSCANGGCCARRPRRQRAANARANASRRA